MYFEAVLEDFPLRHDLPNELFYFYLSEAISRHLNKSSLRSQGRGRGS